MEKSQRKSWLICIDDTDDIGTKGTGEIAEEIAALLLDNAEDIPTYVTRHQLFIHPDIPYTSHNSAMCFKLVSQKPLAEIQSIAVEHLLTQSAAAADPGLAILDLSASFDQQALIEFGLQAKSEVITKQDAYDLAAAQGISLSEHGGTGQGVIGALAGIGLRLYGRDGRVKGQINLCEPDSGQNLFGRGSIESGIDISVAEFLRLSKLDCVVSTSGDLLKPDEYIQLSGKIKAIYWQHQFSLLVYSKQGRWCNALKQHLKEY
ncbi:MAG: DNA-binding protein [Shewanella sp.]|nr:DNA-binding protein [Shewanella sp.]